MATTTAITVGVLALQGGFLEHLTLLHKAASHLSSSSSSSFAFTEVRTPHDLSRCDALVIPGGESTTMALMAAQSHLLEPLREFVKISRKPTWGTCAGLILLAERAEAAKKGGQDLIGGLAVQVRRNHFGRQAESFVAQLDLPFLASSASFPGVFIRAPVVERLLPESDAVDPGVRVPGGAADHPPVEILAVLPGRTERVRGGGSGSGRADGELSGGDEVSDIVAVRQGNVVGTSFHPELTGDVRMHVWWLEQVVRALAVPAV